MLAPWKKSYNQPRQYIKKQRHYFANKGQSSQTMVFPVVMYGCESWTIKKTECQRIDGFELWCWRRLLRVPWTVRRSNPFILKDISPGISLEGLEGMMLNLKLQYFGHLMRRVDSFEKTLMLGGFWGRRRGDNRGWDGWMDHWLDGRESEWTPGVGDRQGGLACCNSWGHKESDRTERLNCTEHKDNISYGIWHKQKGMAWFTYERRHLEYSMP